MRSSLRKHLTRKLIFAALLLVLVLSGVMEFFRIKRPSDVRAYLEMAKECHPVWKQFAFRQVHAGNDAAAFLRQFPSSHHEQQGNDVIHSYYLSSGGLPFSGVCVAERNGYLVASAAWSCTWQFTFFDSVGCIPIRSQD